ncbi:MAG: cytochrome c biogenesis protein CcdC [Gemmatimonadota bacterium]|jgi:membrane protein CcdC involved in cytochrome C biogenesis
MPSALRILAVMAPIAGGLGVLAWRIQETRTPVTARKIIIPPLAMSTGFGMFFSPAMRVPWTWAIGAFLIGALVLSPPLARTSKLERRGDVILMKRSKGFLLILLGLLALRIALHDYVGHLISARQTAAVFFILAFGMILRWRVGMYFKFRELTSDGARSEGAGA